MCVGHLGMWSDVVKIYCNIVCHLLWVSCTPVAGLTSIAELVVLEYITSPGHAQGVKLLCWGECERHVSLMTHIY